MGKSWKTRSVVRWNLELVNFTNILLAAFPPIFLRKKYNAKPLVQWFSTFFGWRHIFHKIIFGDTFLGQNTMIFMCKWKIWMTFPQKNGVSKNFGDTLEKTCDTQMCRDTLFENHCSSWIKLYSQLLYEKAAQKNVGEIDTRRMFFVVCLKIEYWKCMFIDYSISIF
jgi:hypothetical protein